MATTAGSNPAALDSAAGWRVVAAAVLGMIASPSAILMVSFGVLISVLKKEYGWQLDQISIGASIASIMVMVVAPIQGWLVDKYGARRVILSSLPVWALALFAIAMTPNSVWVFWLLCALFPVAAIGIWPLSFLTLPARWFDKRLGLATGVTNVGIGLGAALVPLVMGFAVQNYTWRWGYASMGIFVLVVVLPVCFVFLRDGIAKDAGGEGASQSLQKMTATDAMRLPGFMVLMGSFFILGMTGTSLLVHMVSLLTDAGLSQSDAIKMQAVLGAGTMFGRLVAGWLLDRYTVRAVGIGVFAIGAATSFILATGPVGWLATVSVMLFGLVVGAEFDVMAVAIRRYFGLANFGRIYGLTFAAFQLGAAIGSWSLGAMRAQMGSYSTAMLIFGVALLGGLTLFARLGSVPRVSEH